MQLTNAATRPLHLRSWGSRRGRSAQLIPGAGHHNRHASAVIQKFRMPQYLGLVSIVLRDYDEALAFYVGKLGFSLIEDTCQPAQDKRWVVVSPPGATESALLLARASTEHQATRVGDETGGRVFLFRADRETLPPSRSLLPSALG